MYEVYRYYCVTYDVAVMIMVRLDYLIHKRCFNNVVLKTTYNPKGDYYIFKMLLKTYSHEYMMYLLCVIADMVKGCGGFEKN